MEKVAKEVYPGVSLLRCGNAGRTDLIGRAGILPCSLLGLFANRADM
jgi:hypothetical protein